MSNIVNDLVEDYIRKTLKMNNGILEYMEIYAEENSVPIIHKEVSELLKVILKIHKPKRILEIGCAIGYSSIFFANVLNNDVEIITTERNPIMLEKAYENIKKAGLSDKIKILVGDAEETLKDIDGDFDMVFIDAAKGQYKLFFDIVFDKVKNGGIIISDNILYKGMIASDDFVVKRKKTIVKRMRDYLDYICHQEFLDTSIIPIGDGVAISYKKYDR
ncbi:O-methyltransferase [Peptostreptococcus sp. D1]|uniref:O-methyltransferase n=1 Tax=Peptostreptococcus sp. D1 TaxID=72304 RepID=UPI0008E67E46|nr:O-methyltransferase [Peptostreptococcus sp. D1]SFE74312.1 Predicted O-methyltransferase YrrM [Peptostreptococcus sp. D1]